MKSIIIKNKKLISIINILLFQLKKNNIFYYYKILSFFRNYQKIFYLEYKYIYI